MTDERLVLDVDEAPTEDDLRRVIDGVRSFNRKVGGHQPPRPIATFLRDAAGSIVGGAFGELWGRSLHVGGLWVAEEHRGGGHGSRLLASLERQAIDAGYRQAWVETLSYQARPFYERHGYVVFGTLEAIDENCDYFFMRKDLRGTDGR